MVEANMDSKSGAMCRARGLAFFWGGRENMDGTCRASAVPVAWMASAEGCAAPVPRLFLGGVVWK